MPGLSEDIFNLADEEWKVKASIYCQDVMCRHIKHLGRKVKRCTRMEKNSWNMKFLGECKLNKAFRIARMMKK